METYQGQGSVEAAGAHENMRIYKTVDLLLSTSHRCTCLALKRKMFSVPFFFIQKADISVILCDFM